jgi:hypothetical protein
VHHVEGDIENVLWRAVALSFSRSSVLLMPPVGAFAGPVRLTRGRREWGLQARMTVAASPLGTAHPQQAGLAIDQGDAPPADHP